MCFPVGDPLLQVRSLRTVFYTENGPVRAVDGVSFDVSEGDRLGIVGESGSGKSVTALSILRLIEPPTGEIISGELMWKGRDLRGLSESEMAEVRGGEIAMVFQDPMTALDPVFTIGDQMVETLRIHQGLTRRQARMVAADALAEVGIPQPEQRLYDYPHQFSGGMRQRVVIALALLCRPSLLIADEPTTALDVTTQAQILELIERLAAERKMAVVLITHDLGLVAGFCDDIQVMYAGRVVEKGPAREIFNDPLHPYTVGLLGSVTRLDQPLRRLLLSIPGNPPSLTTRFQGCSFTPRCSCDGAQCDSICPDLVEYSPGHFVACHFPGAASRQEAV